MKKSGSVALGGISAALSIVFMMLAWFPYFTYALPALAGFMLIPLVIEISKRYALSVYLATGILSLWLGEKESAVLYVCFFGIYPIYKALIETKVTKRVLEYIFKFIFFNLAVVVAYLIIQFVFQIPFDLSNGFGKWFVGVLVLVANATFVFYDIAVSRMATYYNLKLRKTIRKIIGR